MTSQTHERRPVTTDEAAPMLPATGNDYDAILPAPSGPLLAVVVTRRLVNGGIRRTVVRSLATAERQVERALAAGCAASLDLVRLEPVDVVTPAELATLEDEAPAVGRRIAHGALTLLADADASTTAREHALATLRAHIGGGGCE